MISNNAESSTSETYLGAVRICTSICHREKAGLRMLQLEVLIYTLNKNPWAI